MARHHVLEGCGLISITIWSTSCQYHGSYRTSSPGSIILVAAALKCTLRLRLEALMAAFSHPKCCCRDILWYYRDGNPTNVMHATFRGNFPRKDTRPVRVCLFRPDADTLFQLSLKIAEIVLYGSSLRLIQDSPHLRCYFNALQAYFRSSFYFTAVVIGINCYHVSV